MIIQTPSALIESGTAEDWLFEGDGPVEEAAWPLLLHLRKSGDWRKIPNRSFTVYSLDGKSPMVVMGKHWDGGNRHFVRINYNWQRPGMYERSLAMLPKSFLSRFETKPALGR